MQYKLRWRDCRANGLPYKDSWVSEDSIPNKGMLCNWLYRHRTDPVLRQHSALIKERRRELIIEID